MRRQEPPRRRDAGHTGRARSDWPRWRALLEARWQDRLQEVTELSVAFHESAALEQGRRPHSSVRQSMRRAVIARRALADVDEALGRLAGGQYGTCESCSENIPAASLARLPEARYCPRCA